ncbi:hypothetical protein ACP70R_019350 [Stipagrostis hirtigluma subsp. patula]
MDELNKWHSLPPEPDEQLSAYVYQQQDEHAWFMQQHHVGSIPLPEQQLHGTAAPPPTAPDSSSFHPSSSGFLSIGSNASFGAVNDPAAGHPPSTGILSFGGQASTVSFSGGDWPGGIEGERWRQQAPENRSKSAQEHVINERKRREKMQQQFVALAGLVPDLTKTDKISLLGGTIEYVKQLENKVKTLERKIARKTSKYIAFANKSCVPNSNDSSSFGEMATDVGGSNPAIGARIQDDTILLKICCNEERGVLAMILSEIENHGLSIINANVMPFTDSCLDITITAKIVEGFSTILELVNNLTTSLRDFT